MEQIRYSHDQISKTIIAISKKHWSTYIWPVVASVLGLILLIGKSYLLGIIFLPAGVMKILSNKSTSWILTDQELIIRSGFLPWRKTYLEIPKEDIYEAFYSNGFLANIFGYGSLTIRRTDGTTSAITNDGMTNPKEIIGAINSLVREIKKNLSGNQLNHNNLAIIADEIEKLIELKNQGLIDNEEFLFYKQKLINQK